MTGAARRRALPVAVIGAVNVLAPKDGQRYYRLTWINPDGTAGRTSAGTTLAAATGKATGLDAELQQSVGALSMSTLKEVLTVYLSTGKGRHQKIKGGDWSRSQLKQQRAQLKRCTRGHLELLAMSVDRVALDRMRAASGTPRTRSENATALRGLLRWGYAQGYFSAEQAELLPANVPDIPGTVKGTQAPARRRRARAVGQHPDFIAPEDAPSVPQLEALGGALAAVFPAWGELAVELAADAGPRWGELFQLTADDVRPLVDRALITEAQQDGALVEIDINWQIDSAASRRNAEDPRCLPKGRKTRRTLVGSRSVTGYPTAVRLLERADAARAEQAAGSNPEALLFPAPGGGLFHYTEFANDFLAEALVEAGWPYQDWVEVKDEWDNKTNRSRRIQRDRRQFDLTWHSLRHRFARTCIDQRDFTAGELMAIGGWENETVVKNRYYKSGEEHVLSAAAKYR